MDDRKNSVSQDPLYAPLDSAAASIIADARRDAGFAGADTPVTGAFPRSPDDVEQSRSYLQSERQVVSYCFEGDELSHGMAAALRIMGVPLPQDRNEPPNLLVHTSGAINTRRIP